jgi:hypothetical protein
MSVLEAEFYADEDDLTGKINLKLLLAQSKVNRNE